MKIPTNVHNPIQRLGEKVKGFCKATLLDLTFKKELDDSTLLGHESKGYRKKDLPNLRKKANQVGKAWLNHNFKSTVRRMFK